MYRLLVDPQVVRTFVQLSDTLLCCQGSNTCLIAVCSKSTSAAHTLQSNSQTLLQRHDRDFTNHGCRQLCRLGQNQKINTTGAHRGRYGCSKRRATCGASR